MQAEKSGRVKRYCVIFSVLCAALLAMLLLNIQIGSVAVSLCETPRILLNPGNMNTDTLTGIVWKIRLPRMLAVTFLGGALALSGFLLQTFFANPIAGPYILGISSGAKLTVSITLIAVLGAGGAVSSLGMIAAAFVGSMISTGFVLAFSQRVARASMLVVCGVMIGYICSAITDFIVTFADDANIVSLHNWSRGSFSGISMDEVKIIAVVVVMTSAAVFMLSKPIGAYQLGEGYAQNMGVNIKAFRVLLVLLSSVLSACVTAFAGPVSFVGIAVPHITKALMKTSRPIVIIPACFLCGFIFCLGCDLIARTMFAPVELAISSVTAVFGAPVVIAIMIKRRGRD